MCCLICNLKLKNIGNLATACDIDLPPQRPLHKLCMERHVLAILGSMIVSI